MKPERWFNPKNKLFTHQAGFTGPPHDFDAAPSDFLRMAPETVGVHGRLLHVEGYEHQLGQRVDNFHLLEEFVSCMANAGADAAGQVGTNWVHAGGKTPGEIEDFQKRMADKYAVPLHMAGWCLVEALRELNVEKIALNSVYYWPDWRDGIARFLREAGFDLVYAGNFVDQGFFETQQSCNDCVWVFPGDMFAQSMRRVAEAAPGAEAVVINGMPNFRTGPGGLPRRPVSLARAFEAETGLPCVASDIALYWRLFKTLGVAPVGDVPGLLARLQG
ncbi:MAG: aspartate racemase/maleate isomerase family protein [Rhodospirillales bacterium]